MIQPIFRYLLGVCYLFVNDFEQSVSEVVYSIHGWPDLVLFHYFQVLVVLQDFTYKFGLLVFSLSMMR